MKIQELSEKILKFGEEINKIKLRQYQWERSLQIIKAVILNESGTFTTLWSRRSGKSEMLKVAMLSLMTLLPNLARTYLVKEFPRLKLFRDGLHVAFAGPKFQTARIPFVRLKRQARQKTFTDKLESLNIDIITSNSHHFELSNESLATAFSGSETASNEGEGAEVLLLDESAMLSPFSVYKILRPMVAHCDGLISETGTPSRKKCPFLTDIEYNKQKFPHLHHEVPYTDVTPFSKDYASFIDGEIDRLPGGMKNPFFRMNYLLHWLIAEGHFVDTNIFLKLATTMRGPSGGRLAAGVDWGKIESATTVTILEDRGNQFVIADLFEIKGDWDHQFEYLVPFLKNYPLQVVYSESNGLGDPLSSRLKMELGADKVEERFMSSTYKDLIFTNLETEITAKPARFSYFDDDSDESKSFIRQFLDAEKEVKGKLLSVHKPKEEGAADDFLISTALALDALRSTPIVTFDIRTSEKKRGIVSELEHL